MHYAINQFTIDQLENELPFIGTSASGATTEGTAAVYQVRGPGRLHLTLADVTWANGERDVRATSRHASPERFDRLLRGLRLVVNGHTGRSNRRVELCQARMKDARWSNLKRATLTELDAALGSSTSEALKALGVTRIGTRADLLKDASPRRGNLCAVFPATADQVPVAAFVITRMAAIYQQVPA